MIVCVNVLLQLVNANDTLNPLVVVMALPSESKTDWFNTTIESLIRYEYDYIIMPSTPKHSRIPGGNATETVRAMGLNIQHANEGALGCWVSHIRAWALQQALQRPVISLEADTRALLPWPSLKKDSWKQYDILFMHSHPHRKVRCNKSPDIQDGLETRYATGAMLFTGRTLLSHVIRLINTQLPIGHWLNLIDNQKKLRIATLCPSLFHQRVDKPSQISINGKY